MTLLFGFERFGKNEKLFGNELRYPFILQMGKSNGPRPQPAQVGKASTKAFL